MTNFEGPLADWVDRLFAKARELDQDPRVRVWMRRSAGIEDERLKKLEESWKVDAFSPAIRNIYRQANGLCLLWISTHHPDFPHVDSNLEKIRLTQYGSFEDPRSFSEFPTPFQVDNINAFVTKRTSVGDAGPVPYGAIYLPPLEKVLMKSKSHFKVYFDKNNTEAVELLGKTWKGKEFEEAIRVFDYPGDYNPAAFVIQEGDPNPPVILADDHNAWRATVPVSAQDAVDFETYMEFILASLGTNDARREWFTRPAKDRTAKPVDITDLLPESINLQTADDGSTFEVTVDSIEAASAREARIALLTDLIPGHRVKVAAKALDLKPFNRKANVLIPEIVDATEDPKAIKSPIASKLLTAANFHGTKNKATFLEVYGVGMGGGESITLKVTTTFDRSGMTTEQLRYNFDSDPRAKQYLADLGVDQEVLDEGWVSSELISETGRNAREATIQVSLSRPSGLEVGHTAHSKATPAFFKEHQGRIYRSI